MQRTRIPELGSPLVDCPVRDWKARQCERCCTSRQLESGVREARGLQVVLESAPPMGAARCPCPGHRVVAGMPAERLAGPRPGLDGRGVQRGGNSATRMEAVFHDPGAQATHCCSPGPSSTGRRPASLARPHVGLRGRSNRVRRDLRNGGGERSRARRRGEGERSRRTGGPRAHSSRGVGPSHAQRPSGCRARAVGCRSALHRRRRLERLTALRCQLPKGRNTGSQGQVPSSSNDALRPAGWTP